MQENARKGWPPKPEWNVAGATGSRGAYACRPGRVLVSRASWEARASGADERIARRLRAKLVPEPEQDGAPPSRLRSVLVLTGAPDVARAVKVLRSEGIDARPDHVFFAVAGTVSSAPVMFSGVHGSPVMFSGVEGAPVMFSGVHGSPVMFSGVHGSPVMFSGVHGVPVMFSGFIASPVMFSGGGGCGCGCPSPTIPGAPPEPRRSTVRRADAPAAPVPDPPAGTTPCKVVVVDTGLAADGLVPASLGGTASTGLRDFPDANDDEELDAATGHGTFIAGIVRRLAPGATVEVRQVLTTFGDASDSEVAEALLELLDDPNGRPDVVNLSFAGYSDDDTTPPAIAEAIDLLLADGVVIVAAAGNDATCRPAWPAATEGVIGVGALDDGGPAWFTNYGDWVEACAPGVDVLAPFFDYAQGTATATAAGTADPPTARPTGGADNALQPDDSGWARWSGTSFAAPIVVGVLARRITDGAAPASAVRAVVEDPDLFRINGLGTVVNARPW